MAGLEHEIIQLIQEAIESEGLIMHLGTLASQMTPNGDSMSSTESTEKTPVPSVLTLATS